MGESRRHEFEMSDEDYHELLAAMRPKPVMYLSGGTPMFDSQQERANSAWCRLGDKMGFDGASVKPVQGKDARIFTAIQKAPQ